jgi:predicted phage tail protein
MIRTVHLHGPLAEKLGYTEPLTFDADNVQTLINGLTMSFPDIRSVMLEFSDVAIVLRDGEELKSLSAERLQYNFGFEPEIHIAGAINGAGIETLTAFFVMEMEISYVAATIAAYAVAIAGMYAVGQIIQSMAEVPQSATAEEKAANSSYLFNGAETVVGQGYPVPLIYGRYLVGSAEISTELSAERLAVALNDNVSIDLLYESGKSGNVLTNDVFGSSSTVSSFTINGVTTAAGGTYNNGQISVTIAANGAYTIIPTVTGDWAVTYNATNAAHGSSSAVMQINVSLSFVDSYGSP